LRQESTTKFTGKLLKHFGGEDGMKNVTITRLDRRVNYLVDYQKKTYQEMPFENLQQMQEQLKGMTAPPRPEGEDQPPSIECDPVRVEAKATGDKRSIAGFDAEEVRITGTQTCRAKGSDAACTMHYSLGVWNTSRTGPFEELQAFYRKQAEAMGMDLQQMQAVASAAQALVAQGTRGMESVYKELSKVGGYPVSTRFVVEKEGACGMGASPEASEGAPKMSDVMKGMGGKLGGMFGKKKDKAEPAEKPGSAPPAAPVGRAKVFGMSHEIVSISSTGAPAEEFEPPPGFKKIADPGRKE
jgi:hypothetical protein